MSLLFDNLRKWRLEESRKIGRPPYFILHDKVLYSLETFLPISKEQLLQVKGIGPEKLDKYGEEIINVIRKTIKITSYVNKSALQSKSPIKNGRPPSYIFKNLEYVDINNGTYAFGIYYSKRSAKHDKLSKQVLSFKDNNSSAINYFMKKIKKLDLSGFNLITHVPSHFLVLLELSKFQPTTIL